MDESSELISEDILAQLNSEDNLDVETLVDEVPQSDTESPVLQNSTSPRATSGSPTKPVKYVKLPLSRIKQIMKMDPDVVIVQQDAIFLVTKATVSVLVTIALCWYSLFCCRKCLLNFWLKSVESRWPQIKGKP